MKTRRIVVAVAAAAAAGFVGGVVTPSSGDAATAPTTYSYTILGTDSHTLNPGIIPDATTNGGVTTLSTTEPENGDNVLEVGLDLPVGAKIKSVAITHLSAHYDATPDSGSFVFGYADPTRQTAAAVFDVTPPGTASGAAPTTYAYTGNPITTITAGRRYVLDWHWPSASGSPTPGNHEAVWYGATFQYTCVAPCHP